jgi:hypothetical protein
VVVEEEADAAFGVVTEEAEEEAVVVVEEVDTIRTTNN